MRNVVAIAMREFVATVATRAFVIGLLVFPALIGLFALLGPRLFDPGNFEIRGEVMIVDPTGRVASGLEKTFDPERIAARRAADARRALANAPEGVQALAGGAAADSLEQAFGPIPDLRIVVRGMDADIEEAKRWLTEDTGEIGRVALVVVHPNAVEPADGDLDYGAFDLYEPERLDDRVRSEIQRGLREAIVSARLQARSIDQDTIDAILRTPPVPSVTLSEGGERQTVRGVNIILPVGFGVLLLMGVMGGGGQLLTTMVEEKSSRVVEVLLSAVSPMELMAGKLLGQMAVSLVGMSLYLAMGLAALASFALFGLLDFSLIFYLLIFFVITYLVMGSLMMAVGSAVNDMREAQGLLMPLMLVFMLPWFLWMPISRDPNSTLSTVVSFLPPLNTFGMLLRMASNSPPPAWQVWVSIALGIASVFVAVWFAAKVFRIGLLMYGKPPSIGTLIRWVRAA